MNAAQGKKICYKKRKTINLKGKITSKVIIVATYTAQGEITQCIYLKNWTDWDT